MWNFEQYTQRCLKMDTQLLNELQLYILHCRKAEMLEHLRQAIEEMYGTIQGVMLMDICKLLKRFNPKVVSTSDMPIPPVLVSQMALPLQPVRAYHQAPTQCQSPMPRGADTGAVGNKFHHLQWWAPLGGGDVRREGLGGGEGLRVGPTMASTAGSKPPCQCQHRGPQARASWQNS